jgi:tryptophanyl-tRNA synthetase
VTEAVEAVLAPVRARQRELAADPGEVRRVLAEGRDRVRSTARATVRRARQAIGLLD